MEQALRTLVGPHSVGAEMVNKSCWKCGKQLFVISGIITTTPECAHWDRGDWDRGSWSIRDFYALYQFPDDSAHQLSAELNKIAQHAKPALQERGMSLAILQRRNIKSAGTDMWASTCPHCKAHDGPAKLVENERVNLLRDWDGSRRARKLVYRGVSLDFRQPQRCYDDIKGDYLIRRMID